MSERVPLTICVSSGLCKHIHFPLTEAQERTCMLSDKDILLLSRLLSLTHTPQPKARLWSQSSHSLAPTSKPRPDSFYPGWGVKLLWAGCIGDGERQDPWEGDLDPGVRGHLNMSTSLSVVQGSSYHKKVYVNMSGALNMITNIAPLNDEKGNCFTSKCLLLSLLIRSLPCTQIQVGKGHFFKLASLGISNSLRDAGRDSCKQHDKGAKGSLGWRILMACCLRITLSPETSLCSVYSLSTHWQQSGDFIKRVTNKVKFL